MVKVNFADGKYYNEIFQNTDVKFSFLHKEDDGTFKELFYRAKCRDFLGDVIYGTKYSIPTSIYGFTWEGDKHNIDADACRLLVQFPDKLTKNIFLAQKDEWGINWGIYCDVEDNPLCIVVEADPKWQERIYMISLLTLLIKLSTYNEEVRPLTGNEAVYVGKIPPAKTILKYIDEIPYVNASGYDNEHKCSLYKIHDESGVVAIFGDETLNNKYNLYRKHAKELGLVA
jgi:hypothetical protein